VFPVTRRRLVGRESSDRACEPIRSALPARHSKTLSAGASRERSVMGIFSSASIPVSQPPARAPRPPHGALDPTSHAPSAPKGPSLSHPSARGRRNAHTTASNAAAALAQHVPIRHGARPSTRTGESGRRYGRSLAARPVSPSDFSTWAEADALFCERGRLFYFVRDTSDRLPPRRRHGFDTAASRVGSLYAPMHPWCFWLRLSHMS